MGVKAGTTAYSDGPVIGAPGLQSRCALGDFHDPRLGEALSRLAYGRHPVSPWAVVARQMTGDLGGANGRLGRSPGQ